MNNDHEGMIRLLCVILEIAILLCIAGQVLRALCWFCRYTRRALPRQGQEPSQTGAQGEIESIRDKAPLQPGELHCASCGGYGVRSLTGRQGVAICWDCNGTGKHAAG